MRRRIPLIATAAVVVGLAVSLAFALAPKAGRFPQGFVGMMADGPLSGRSVDLVHQLDVMVASGVQSLRVVADWSAAQPYQSFSQVPTAHRSEFEDLGGVPTRLADFDHTVALAAERGLSLLPVVEYAPAWDALHPGSRASPPASPAPYANFLTTLIRRYGPNGTFWAAHPRIARRPIRMWQIWNEPDFATYWSEQPFAPSYVRLLGATHAAIQAADPGAKLVLAGLPNFSWQYLDQIYKVPGARRLFDVVAIHPYTAQPRGVIVILRKVRAVMSRAGDGGKPMLATEISWPSSSGRLPPQFGNETTESGQASKLAAVIPLLAQNRSALHLIGFYYYTWMGDEGGGVGSFDFAGLFKYVHGQVSAKPAFRVFARGALSIEGCRRKGTVASECR